MLPFDCGRGLSGCVSESSRFPRHSRGQPRGCVRRRDGDTCGIHRRSGVRIRLLIFAVHGVFRAGYQRAPKTIVSFELADPAAYGTYVKLHDAAFAEPAYLTLVVSGVDVSTAPEGKDLAVVGTVGGSVSAKAVALFALAASGAALAVRRIRRTR